MTPIDRPAIPGTRPPAAPAPASTPFQPTPAARAAAEARSAAAQAGTAPPGVEPGVVLGLSSRPASVAARKAGTGAGTRRVRGERLRLRAPGAPPAPPTVEEQADARDGVGVKVLATGTVLDTRDASGTIIAARDADGQLLGDRDAEHTLLPTPARPRDSQGNLLTDVRDGRVVRDAQGRQIIGARDNRARDGTVLPGERDVPDERGLVGSREVLDADGKTVVINRAGLELDSEGVPTGARLVLDAPATAAAALRFVRTDTRAARPGELGHKRPHTPGNSRRFDVVYWDRSHGIESASSANEVRDLVKRRDAKLPLSIKLIRE